MNERIYFSCSRERQEIWMVGFLGNFPLVEPSKYFTQSECIV